MTRYSTLKLNTKPEKKTLSILSYHSYQPVSYLTQNHMMLIFTHADMGIGSFALTWFSLYLQDQSSM